MRLFYRKYGDPKNKPIVVIFGLLGVSENWDFFGKRFAELGYYVLVPDVRNHGQSPHSDVFNYDVLAGDIKQIILNIIQTHVRFLKSMFFYSL